MKWWQKPFAESGRFVLLRGPGEQSPRYYVLARSTMTRIKLGKAGAPLYQLLHMECELVFEAGKVLKDRGRKKAEYGQSIERVLDLVDVLES